MIGWLHGTIGDRWQEGNRCWLLLICGPVGYELQVSESLWQGTALEAQTTIHTHLQQREDGQQLYGFETKADRNLFRLLISVNGVGPQVALGLISGLGAVSLLQAMAAEDVKVLCQAPGVGKRTAERLSLEWRSRLQERWQQQGGTTPLRLVEPVAESRELRATLEALGYGPEEVSAAVAQAGSQGLDPEQPMEEWLRHCLAWLSRQAG